MQIKPIKPIKTEQDYEAALRAVEPMFDNEPPADTPEGDFFEIMCVLINEYEKNTIQLKLLILLKLLNSEWSSRV